MNKKIYGEVSVADMANRREARVRRQDELIAAFGLPLVSFTLNIAGPVKNSGLIEFGFYIGLNDIINRLGGFAHLEIENSKTGCEALIAVDFDADLLKQSMVEIEEGTALGRWYDIDVLTTNGCKLSRPYPRRCMICGELASICARSRAHSVQELQECTWNAFADAMADMLAELACSALYDEVHLTPKPGLVDERNSGANADMDITTFEKSINAIRPYYSEMARFAAHHGNDLKELMKRLQMIGVEAEYAMLDITGGVNTHRGAIYTLGLLISAYAIMIASNDEYSERDVVENVTYIAAKLSKYQIIDDALESNGAIVRKAYGVYGAREQAAAGFPIVKTVISCYEEYLKLDYPNPWAAALLAAMETLDDNNALRRGGAIGAEFVKRRAGELRRLGCGLTDDELMRFDEELIELNISCGGAADTLAAAMLLNKLKMYLAYDPASCRM